MRIQPGEISRFTAEYLTRQMERLDALLQITGVAPVMVDLRGDTPIVSIINKTRITARITGHYDSRDPTYSATDSADSADSVQDYTDEESCRYSFIEVRVDPDTCTAPDLIGGFVGFTDISPAVHIGGSVDVAVDTVVELWRSVDGSHWEFSASTDTGPMIPITILVNACLTDATDSAA